MVGVPNASISARDADSSSRGSRTRPRHADIIGRRTPRRTVSHTQAPAIEFFHCSPYVCVLIFLLTPLSCIAYINTIHSMRITIDSTDRRAIYQQVADGIKALIASGELAGGAALPPVRQLAADLGVNLNTIAAAYRELHDERLITVKHGSGAVVAAKMYYERNDDKLRGTLRTALTEMVLAGLTRTQILRLVGDELQGLLRGSR